MSIPAQNNESLPSRGDLPHTKISARLDKFVTKVGEYSSWLWIITIGFILYSVVSRYLFGQGSVMLEEVQWHLAGAAWLIGLSYTLVDNEHVRVDVLHERLSRKSQAWIEVFGLALLLLPFLFITLNEMIPYVYSSYEQGEVSISPNGLPYRWLIKLFLPLAIVLLIIASFSRLLRVIALLSNKSNKKGKN